MVIYRPYTGGFEKSAKQTREFKDFDEMSKSISQEWAKKCGADMFAPDDIVFSELTFEDARLGWGDTRYVYIKSIAGNKLKVPSCIGMCATKYFREVRV